METTAEETGDGETSARAKQHDDHRKESAVGGIDALVRETTLRNDIIPLIRYHQPCQSTRRLALKFNE